MYLSSKLKDGGAAIASPAEAKDEKEEKDSAKTKKSVKDGPGHGSDDSASGKKTIAGKEKPSTKNKDEDSE
jgi:hypothetical protein